MNLLAKTLITQREKKVYMTKQSSQQIKYISQCFIAKPKVAYNFIYKAFLFEAKGHATNK